MKKLLITSLCLVLLSLTAAANVTSIDSIEKAFDNCVYKHDSLVREIEHAKEIISMDSAVNAESNAYINLLQKQVDELKIQIAEFELIKKKQEEDLVKVEEEKQLAIQKVEREQKFKGTKKAVISGTASFAGGVGVGGLIVGLYFLLK